MCCSLINICIYSIFVWQQGARRLSLNGAIWCSFALVDHVCKLSNTDEELVFMKSFALAVSCELCIILEKVIMCLFNVSLSWHQPVILVWALCWMYVWHSGSWLYTLSMFAEVFKLIEPSCLSEKIHDWNTL